MALLSPFSFKAPSKGINKELVSSLDSSFAKEECKSICYCISSLGSGTFSFLSFFLGAVGTCFINKPLFALTPPLLFDSWEGVFFEGEILLVLTPSFPFFFVL